MKNIIGLVRHRKAILATVLTVFGVIPAAEAVSVQDIPGLVSITFWERTGGTAPTPATFAVVSPELSSRLSDPLGPGNNDITGVIGHEFYDVFYSNADGAFNPDGEYLTIEGVYDNPLPAGGGLNLAEIGLNFSADTEFGIYVSSFMALGDNALPFTAQNAIDGDLQTHTTMGNTVGSNRRLRLTLGFLSSSGPAPLVSHDLAIVRLKAPKTINLNAATPALTKRVVIQVQNRSAHKETVPNLLTLERLVGVTVEPLGIDCGTATPQAALVQGPPNKVPRTLKRKQKMNVFFDVTFTDDCVPDPLKNTGQADHSDFRFVATVDHTALDGLPDTHSADDNCPRTPLAGGVDNEAGLNIRDKGCGKKDQVTRQLGADVLTDIVVE